MAKYLILYNSSVKASDLMAHASPEEMKASMDEWIKWREAASKSAKIEFGLPLQIVAHVETDGVTYSVSQVSGYSIMEGESRDGVVDLLKNHPHLSRPDASIDVLEMLSMPGIDA